MFRDNERLLKSIPIRTEMLGMQSTTARMQQAGWEFTAEQQIHNMTVRLIARHQQAHMYAMSETIDINFFEAASTPGMLASVVFNFPYVASHLRVEVQTPSMNFKPIDAMPQFTYGREVKDVEDFGIFATPLVRTNEIIVPEESVGDLLNRILEYQEPTKSEYFKHKLRNRCEGEDITAQPQQKFHAQVISISDAA